MAAASGHNAVVSKIRKLASAISSTYQAWRSAIAKYTGNSKQAIAAAKKYSNTVDAHQKLAGTAKTIKAVDAAHKKHRDSQSKSAPSNKKPAVKSAPVKAKPAKKSAAKVAPKKSTRASSAKGKGKSGGGGGGGGNG